MTVIKVLGLGGGGSNAVDRMIQLGIEGVEFIAANTDMQALARSEAPVKLLLGPRLSRGLGSGGDPEKGREAAKESLSLIADAVQGAEMVFIAAGMGGGTGTGSAPVAAQLAREAGAVTVGVVTLPFSFEATRRLNNARRGIDKLKTYCDTLIAVPNDKLLSILPRDVSFDVALRVADDVLRQGIQGMAELVTRPGLINVDFANVRALMQLPGGAFLSMGQGKGSNKAGEAMHEALHHKLLEANSLDDAQGVLVHFTGGADLSLFEISQAMGLINRSAHPKAQIVMGATLDPMMTGRAQVILVATGVGGKAAPITPLLTVVDRVKPAIAASTPAPASVPVTPESLAGSLFANVPAQPGPGPAEWVVAGHGAGYRAEASEPTPSGISSELMPQILSPENLDIPAFMRRRRLRR
jgi:cell division protein FtsZ